MQFFALAAAFASAGLVAAQTTTYGRPPASASPSSICAQDIVDACVNQYTTQVKGCAGNEYLCLCDNFTNMLTCYNNCPDSPARAPVQNQAQAWCAAAAPQLASRSAALATMPKQTSTPTATGTAAAAASSGAAAASASTKAGAAAANFAVPVGGAFAALLGVAGLL